jgi:hypothetical protein
MTRKHWMLLGCIIALGGISVYINKDFFRGENIQIVHRPVPERLSPSRKPPKFGETRVAPILFSFDRKLALTEVKVVSVAEIETNRFAHPTWHLVSDSNSVPTLGIVYGSKVPGMRPAVKGATPDVCVPGTKYRLIVQAGANRAEHDFTVQNAAN